MEELFRVSTQNVTWIRIRILELERNFKWHLDIYPLPYPALIQLFLLNIALVRSFPIHCRNLPRYSESCRIEAGTLNHLLKPLSSPLPWDALGWACHLVAAPGIGLTLAFSVISRPQPWAPFFFAFYSIGPDPHFFMSIFFNLIS